MTSSIANSSQEEIPGFGSFELFSPEVRELLFTQDAEVYKIMRSANKAYHQELDATIRSPITRETKRLYQNITNACYVKQSYPLTNNEALYFKGSSADSSVIYGFNYDRNQRQTSYFSLQVNQNGQVVNLSDEVKAKVKDEIVQDPERKLHVRSFVKLNEDKTIEWGHATDVFDAPHSFQFIHQFSTRDANNENKASYTVAREVRGFAALRGVDAVLVKGQVYLFSAENDHESFKTYLNFPAEGKAQFLAKQKKLKHSTVGVKTIGTSADGKQLYLRGVDTKLEIYDFASEQARPHKFASILARLRTLTFYLRSMATQTARIFKDNFINVVKISGIITGVSTAFVTSVAIGLLLMTPAVTSAVLVTTALVIATIAVCTFVGNAGLSSFTLGLTGMYEGARNARWELNY